MLVISRDLCASPEINQGRCAIPGLSGGWYLDALREELVGRVPVLRVVPELYRPAVAQVEHVDVVALEGLPVPPCRRPHKDDPGPFARSRDPGGRSRTGRSRGGWRPPPATARWWPRRCWRGRWCRPDPSRFTGRLMAKSPCRARWWSPRRASSRLTS